MDLRELAMDLRSGTLTPVQHIERVLSTLDGAGNLVVGRDDSGALAQAHTATAEIGSGAWRGPLHGVAIAVKDNIDVAGMPTRCGSAVFADAAPALADAEVVARLRAAGAIVVAKSHCHEFAYGPTGDVSVDGPAANPWDAGRITGGSSSGSAALVALGAVALAVGTDTGCSVRVPAALCGVVGLKPTLGAVPTDGVFPLSTTLDHVGVLTADVHGASVAWDVLARGAEGTGGGIQEPGVQGLRIGLPQGSLWQVRDLDIGAAVAAAAEALRRAGADVVEIEVPDVEELAATYGVIVGSEAYAIHAAALSERPGDFQPSTAERLVAQAGRSAYEYLSALGTVQRLRRSTLATLRRTYGLDALLLATAPLRATPLGESTVDGADVRAELLRLCAPFNLLGVPAVSVPARGVEGLPIGVQVAGIKLEERGVLRVAAAIS
ncbi:MAG: amidase [Actinomycetota bacterium]|nr:amidase [Actinomycetota bacterium]